MTKEAEILSHVIFRTFIGVVQLTLGQWLCGKWGKRGAKRGDSLPFRLCSSQPLCQTLPVVSHFPFPLLRVGVKDWSTTRRKHRGSSASQHLIFDRTDLIFSFLSPSPHQQSCPKMSQTWLKAPVCSQAHRSVKSSCCLFSKLLSELLSQESYQNSSCDIKQNKYIVIWTEGDVQIPGTHHTSKPKSHLSGTLIWELVQESVCLIIRAN